MTELRGIAWNHSRGFVSVVATAQRYEEYHPEIRITWEKRSLQAFADASMEALARAYDLIIMDHPHTALAAREGAVVALDTMLDTGFLEDQAKQSVGHSHQSYYFAGHQWTLATDAAAPIATWRPDIIAACRLDLPKTWEDVLDMAEAGHVTACLFPIDCLMYLYMFCNALGDPAFAGRESLCDNSTLAEGLEMIRQLAQRVAPECLDRNPIRTAEFMSTSMDASAAYCPFAYGYSNYSRPLYAECPLKAGPLVTFRNNPLRSVLGGAGVAVSAYSRHRQTAAEYAAFCASPKTQKGIYFTAGGQPGHRTAWMDDAINAQSLNFFKDTLETLDSALLRPQYPGYMTFQNEASPVVHACIRGIASISETVASLQSIYQRSLHL